MKPISFLTIGLYLSLIIIQSVNGQSLADVVNSISERQDLIRQRKATEDYLKDVLEDGSSTISFSVSGEYPSDTEYDGWTVKQCVARLN